MFIMDPRVRYSPLQLEPTFLGFPYKMPLGARVKTYLKVMVNPPLLFQLLALMCFGCKISSDSGDSSCQIFETKAYVAF